MDQATVTSERDAEPNNPFQFVSDFVYPYEARARQYKVACKLRDEGKVPFVALTEEEKNTLKMYVLPKENSPIYKMRLTGMIMLDSLDNGARVGTAAILAAGSLFLLSRVMKAVSPYASIAAGVGGILTLGSGAYDILFHPFMLSKDIVEERSRMASEMLKSETRPVGAIRGLLYARKTLT